MAHTDWSGYVTRFFEIRESTTAETWTRHECCHRRVRVSSRSLLVPLRDVLESKASAAHLLPIRPLVRDKTIREKPRMLQREDGIGPQTFKRMDLPNAVLAKSENSAPKKRNFSAFQRDARVK
jgi:hypothetical protein